MAVENELCLEAENHFIEAAAKLSIWKQNHSQLNYLLAPLLTWLAIQQIGPQQSTPDLSVSDGSELDLLLNSLLVSVQSLVPRCLDIVDAEEDPEKYILKGYLAARDFTHHLNLQHVKAQLQETLLRISSHVDISNLLDKALPFLSIFLDLAKEQLTRHNNWTKAIFKLDFVICSLLNTLTQQGFCQPQESGESDANGQESEETGGVGIGEGSGKENVSKDIEDESQVEGLKGDDAESNEPEGQHEGGDAIEMNDDFGGALEDVDEPGSDDEENKSEDGSEPEFDETIGDLEDLDPSAVDEKMWGDEKGPENDDREEKADQDHSKEQDAPSEVTAKESKEQSHTKEPQRADNQPAEDPEMIDEQEENKEEGDNDKSTDPDVNGTKMDEYVDNANTLELPDEMDLGDADMDNGDANKGEDMEDFDDDNMAEDDESHVEDGEQDSIDDFKANDPVKDDPTDTTDENKPTDEIEQNPLDSGEGNERTNEEEKETEDAPEDVVARPDLSKEGGMADPSEVAMPEAGESSSTGEAGTSQSGTGEAAATEEKTADDEG